MVAISFSKKPEFPQMIIDGTKDQTIRPYNPKRFEQIKRIRKLQLYWKQRTKQCFKIADAWATELFKLKFDEVGFVYVSKGGGEYVLAEPMEYNEIVTRDGFKGDPIHLQFVLEDTYGDLSKMEFMVIRFKVTDIPNYTYEFIKRRVR